MRFLNVALTIVVILFPAFSWAQKGLFDTEISEARGGFLLGANTAFDIPAGDLKNRFGSSYRIGASVHYKTKNNWLFGTKFEFNNGDKINEDSLFNGIKDDKGTFININGQRLGINTYRRGYMTGIEIGKIFNLNSANKDNGILIMTGIGFMQHKILIQDKGESILPLRGDYRKGYDRLTNGIYLEQYAGYMHLSKNALVNFHIGLNIALGFTEGRRNYLFDVQRPGLDNRLDILYGIRAGWFLPIFKHKSEEIFFD